MPVLAETAAEDRGSAALVTAVVVILFLLVGLLLWGLIAGHWFGFNAVSTVGTAPSSTPPPASPSASAS
jgi:hypothetical protein